MPNPLVSVVIPSYNHEKYISTAVESVLNQTYSNLELIIVDDGSKDFSLTILKKYKNKDSRIRLLAQENQGAHAAINRGLSECKGEFVTILNSDDVFLAHRFETILKVFDEYPHFELISTWLEFIDKNGRHIAEKRGWKDASHWPVPNFEQLEDFNLNLLMFNFVITTSNIFMRHDSLKKLGRNPMRNLRFAHDWDFLLRFACIGKCFLLEQTLIQYRVHSENTISSNRKGMLFEICWVLASNFSNFENLFLFDFDNTNVLRADIRRLSNSIKLYGNDKVFWLLRSLFWSAEQKGVSNFEEEILNDATLRDILIQMIVD